MSSTYRLTGRIETGELAELYEAVQEPEGSKVVVKLFHPKTSDPRYATVLARTYSVLNPLRSEGIVHVVGMGFVKNRLALVRQAVEGHSLGAALQRLNSKEVLLSAPTALSLILQLLDTVGHAHSVGVVHGALTPGNVLLSRAGRPEVADFGALQALLEVPELKRAFASRGRSAYRAPEVGRGGSPDVLSDVYSLGAILYELLTLREALVPEGGVSTRRGGLPPPSRLDRRLHARLDPILLRALEPSPSRRYPSCAEFASALRNFASSHGGLSGNEELRRFVQELYPNEVAAGSLGPVPFTESFTLTSISGVSPAQVSADVPEKSVVARPSFSPAPSEADTMEAPPAFEEYQPEPTPTPGMASPLDPAVLSSTQLITPGAESEEPTDLTQPVQEKIAVTLFEPKPENSRVDHRTLPPLDDDEPTWVAPPGAPPKPRKATVMVGGAAAEGSRVGRKPRLRVVEDYSAPAQPPLTPEALADTDKIEVTTVRGRVVAEGTLSRSKVTEGTVTRARIPPSEEGVSRSKVTEGTVTRARVPPADGGVSRSKVTEGTVTRARVPPSLVRSAPASESSQTSPPERSDIALPPPSRPELPAVAGAPPQRRLFTEERNLLADARRRRRMLVLAGCVALLATVCFAVALWRFSQWPHFDVDPQVTAASGEVEQVLAQQATPPPKPKPPAPPPPEPPPVHTREEGLRTHTAWLSISANQPARLVQLDGVPFKHNLPLTWLPVKPGVRKITLEQLAPPNQRQMFSVRVEAGEHQKLEQYFPPPPAHR